LLKIFRQNLLISSILLLPYTILVRLHDFIYPQPVEAHDGGILYDLIISVCKTGMTQSVVAVILIFIQAWMINYMVSRNRLTKNFTSLAGIIYILFMSACVDMHGLNPIIVANTFIILFFQELFYIYKKPRSAMYLFNAGFYLGMATLVFFPVIAFVIVGLLGILIINVISIKRMLQFLIGVSAPIYLFFTLLYFNQSEQDLWQGVFHFGLPDFSNISLLDYYHLIPAGLGLLFIIFSYNGYMQKQSIQVQNKLDLLFWMLLFSILIPILSVETSYFLLQILAFPLAIFLHINFMRLEHDFVGGMIHLVALLGIFALHFSVHLG